MACTIGIIGAGLAGSEAALVLARAGAGVTLFEMRPGVMTPAHTTGLPAELVCSNSLKADDAVSAHGLLKQELTLLGSPLLEAARACRVPAGSALAVDRLQFSANVERLLQTTPGITRAGMECAGPPAGCDFCIIAAGPLASEPLTRWLQATFPADSLHFYDAIAPIISFDSIDRGVAFYGARHDSAGTDYLNCPFSEEQYRAFYDALVEADRTVARAFEDARFFEACLPVEVIAGRGYRSLSFGTLRPIGLIDPRTGRRPFAVCQLRRENTAGESWNMVGFQTRLTMPAQKQVFRLIPGLEQAEFLRYGSIHRNTYLDSPRLLGGNLSFRQRGDLFLAGQICGGEGYTESIATGHLAALFLLARVRGRPLPAPPPSTALGALLRHVTGTPAGRFTPSNVNFGLIDPPPAVETRRTSKKEKRARIVARALDQMRQWIAQNGLR